MSYPYPKTAKKANEENIYKTSREKYSSAKRIVNYFLDHPVISLISAIIFMLAIASFIGEGYTNYAKMPASFSFDSLTYLMVFVGMGIAITLIRYCRKGKLEMKLLFDMDFWLENAGWFLCVVFIWCSFLSLIFVPNKYLANHEFTATKGQILSRNRWNDHCELGIRMLDTGLIFKIDTQKDTTFIIGEECVVYHRKGFFGIDTVDHIEH